MNVYEMEGFLRGKCLPGDLKVNESNAEYLVRKLNVASGLKGELTAALATIEKCREVSGCPAGVDLQDHLRQLAAENVGLKESVEHAAGCIAAAEAEGLIDALAETTDERLADLVHRRLCHAYLEVETPATSAYLAGIRADALPGNIAEIIDSGDLETICYESERSYAEDFRLALYNFRQLREGAK